MTPLEELKSLADPQKAQELQAYMKTERECLGIRVPEIDKLAKRWRSETDLEGRIKLAAMLWDTNIHEARVAATKLFTQARIRPGDEAVWQEICRWVPEFDGWALADHAASAGSRRLVADPSRIDEIESWTTDENMWVRRAALVMTLPWTKMNHPGKEDLAIRERVLGWAAGYVDDHQWFIQKAIGWWLRSLSTHDPDRVRKFVAEYGERMKPFAVREALRNMPDQT